MPVSSHTAFSLLADSIDLSVISLSTAKRLPNSISSSFIEIPAGPDSEEDCTCTVPACCSSWIAASVSSYFRNSLPVLKEKIRMCRSVRSEVVVKYRPSGEKVSELGRDFVWRADREGWAPWWAPWWGGGKQARVS